MDRVLSLAMNKDVKTIKSKGGTSELAKQLGKVSRACKILDYTTQGQMQPAWRVCQMPDASPGSRYRAAGYAHPCRCASP